LEGTAMTMQAPSAPLDLPVTLRADRSILRRFVHWLIEGQKRRATHDTPQHLDTHEHVLQDNFRVELERRMMGHVWTVPAVQEESDHQRSVRVRSCIRPIVAWRITSVAMQPLWPLALM
jgi:hypothetical protein